MKGCHTVALPFATLPAGGSGSGSGNGVSMPGLAAPHSDGVGGRHTSVPYPTVLHGSDSSMLQGVHGEPPCTPRSMLLSDPYNTVGYGIDMHSPCPPQEGSRVEPVEVVDHRVS